VIQPAQSPRRQRGAAYSGRPLRVTMVNKYYAPHLGGIEYHMRDLANALVAGGWAHVRAIVSNRTEKATGELLDGVEVFRLPRAFEYASTPVAYGMKRILKAEMRRHRPPDVMHLHFPYPWGEVSWLRARTKTPTVLTYHSDIVRQKGMLALYRPFLNRLLDRVDLIIASSPDMVEHSEFLRRHVDKCRVVPFGIDAERFAETPEIAGRVAQIRAEHTRPVVLFVGRLIYYKGVDVLVRAMAAVDADLVIVGTGPLEDELVALAASLGISDRVTVLPPLPGPELAAYYRAADIFCLPSIARSEAFGLVQLEAHAAGTPVVSTRLTTGVPFANQHGVTGLTVPPGDVEALASALDELVRDEALRACLGAQAHQRVTTEFTVPRMVERTLEVYHEAIRLHGTVAS